MNDIAALEVRITRLENDFVDLRTTITSGFADIKAMLREEISDLKKEQISDIKNDNQRLWKEVADLKIARNERDGSNKAFINITHFIAVMFGGLVTWLATWIASGKAHP
jgi:hypothetical protein